MQGSPAGTRPSMKKCSVIIINFNTAELTLQAVHSVIEFTSNSTFEIIVVDNASHTNDFLRLKEKIAEWNDKRIHLFRSRVNLGFGGGNMQGVQHAEGQYYVFLNSDAYLQEDSISTMTAFLEKNSRVSMVGGRSVDQTGKPYKAFDHRLSLRKELFGDSILHLLNPRKYPSRKKQLSEPTRVGAVPGSFFVCRASDFDQVGGFDTNIFLYYEEKDLAFRIEKELGKEIYSLPQVNYVHLKGKSTSAGHETRKELKISQFYTIRKNLGAFKYLIFYGVNFLKILCKAPFKRKHRVFLPILGGAPLSQSLKHHQKITPLL